MNLKKRLLNNERVRLLMKRLPKDNQQGFTLIELLVVISILGILAAVVTMSLVGITNVASERAAKVELQTVQTAYDAMLQDQGVPPSDVCPNPNGAATANMSAFPSTMHWEDPTTSTPDSNIHSAKQLYPHYLRQPSTHGTYTCDTNGTVIQKSYSP